MQKSGGPQKTPNQENDKFRDDITRLIISNTNAIRNPGARMQAFLDPTCEEGFKKRYIDEIDNLLEQIKVRIIELEPWVERIRDRISDITEKSPISAAYFLLNASLQSFYSILLLGKDGYYLEIMTINRKIEEADMQCNLLMIDYSEGKTKNLEDWFSGKIISHGLGRDKIGKLHSDAPVDMDAIR